MASHGVFAREYNRGRGDSYHRGGGGRQSRKVNFHSQHDDRFEDTSDGGNNYSNRGGGYKSRGGGGGDRGRGGQWTRGRGDKDGQWTRGRGNRGNNRGGRGRGYNDRNQGGDRRGGNYGNDDYGYDEGGAGPTRSYNKGKSRFTPYTKSPPSGEKSGGVFNRLGGPSYGSSRGNYRGNRDRGNRGQRGDRRGGGFGDHSDRRVSYQRTESDNVMEEDTSSVIMRVLGERYDPVTMSLNLSDMFHDKILQEHKIRGSMFDVGFVSTVLDLIATNCPTLKALDLSNNKLQRLQAYSQLREKCPCLETLDLSNNEFYGPEELETIAPMPSVTALILDSGSSQSQDFGRYAGTVRKCFPNLELLDGQPLPGPIKFDLPASVGTLPLSQKGYLVNEEVRSLVLSFLEQFYSLYDGETRDKLLEAYSDNAVFSMSVSPTQQKGPPLQQYIHSSRNLVRVQDSGKRSSLLKHGRIDIVQCLRQFPQSYHLASTFSVDVMKANPMSTGFTVYGLFGEADTGGRSESHPIRAFVRTFVIVAAGTGVAIVNDQLTIRNASISSVKQYSDEVQSHFARLQPPLPLIPPSSSLNIPSSSFPSSLSMAPATGFNNEEEMIQQFGLVSGMNYTYSKKCLAENGWNYDKAMTTFKIFQEQGTIPIEAFQRETFH